MVFHVIEIMDLFESLMKTLDPLVEKKKKKYIISLRYNWVQITSFIFIVKETVPFSKDMLAYILRLIHVSLNISDTTGFY